MKWNKVLCAQMSDVQVHTNLHYTTINFQVVQKTILITFKVACLHRKVTLQLNAQIIHILARSGSPTVCT